MKVVLVVLCFAFRTDQMTPVKSILTQVHWMRKDLISSFKTRIKQYTLW